MPRGIPNNPEVAAAKKAGTIVRARTDSHLSQSEAQARGIGGDIRDPNKRTGTRPVARSGDRLAVPEGLLDTDNFNYRWYSGDAKDGRASNLDEALRTWWEHVVDSQGNNYKRPSGDESLFLMRLPKKDWEEGKALKAKKIRDRMESSISVGEGQYTPNGRNEALTVR